MKNLRKYLIAIVIIISLIFITGCGNKQKKNDNNQANTLATKLVLTFKETIKEEKDLEKVATKISEDENIKIAVEVSEIEEGYLDGFDNEITGFKKAYAIRPMISTQPFIAYVFETNNTKELENTLKENANKRWNICTEAEELEISIVNDYVFIVMSPKSFDE